MTGADIAFGVFVAYFCVLVAVGIWELWESRDFDESSPPLPRPKRRRAGFRP